jgi:hypothetical protein
MRQAISIDPSTRMADAGSSMGSTIQVAGEVPTGTGKHGGQKGEGKKKAQSSFHGYRVSLC